MDKTMNYVLKGVKILLILLGVAFTMWTLNVWEAEWGEGTSVNGFEILKDHPELARPLGLVVNLWIYVIALTFIVMLVFWLVKLASDVKAGLPSLGGLLVIVIICCVAYYGMATNEVLDTWSITDKDGITPDISLAAGAGIYVAYILGAIAVGAVVFTEVKGLIK